MGGISSRSLRRGPLPPEVPRHHHWETIQKIPDPDVESDTESQEADLEPGPDDNNWPKSCPVLHLDINNDFELEAQRKVVRSCYRMWIFTFWTLVLNVVGVVATQLTANITSPSAMELSFALCVIYLFAYFFLGFRALYWAFRLESNIFYIWFYFFSIACLGLYAYFIIQALSFMTLLAAPLAPGSPLPVKANPVFPMIVFGIVISFLLITVVYTFYFLSSAFKWQLMSDEKKEQIFRKERRKGWLLKFFKGGDDPDDDSGENGYRCMLQYENHKGGKGKKSKQQQHAKNNKEERLNITGRVAVENHFVVFRSDEPVMNHVFSVKSYYTDVTAMKKAGKTEIHILENCNEARPAEDRVEMYKKKANKQNAPDVRVLIYDLKTEKERKEMYNKMTKLWKKDKKNGDPSRTDNSLSAMRIRLLRQTKERDGNHLLTHKHWLTLVKHIGKIEFKAGQTIMEPGGFFDFLFYLSEGAVDIQIETSGFTDPGDGDSDSEVDLDEIMFPSPPASSLMSPTSPKIEDRIFGFGHKPNEYDEVSGIEDENCVYFVIKFTERRMGFSFLKKSSKANKRGKNVEPVEANPPVERAVVLSVKPGSQARAGHLRPGDEIVRVDLFNVEENNTDQKQITRIIKTSQFPLEIQFRRNIKPNAQRTSLPSQVAPVAAPPMEGLLEEIIETDKSDGSGAPEDSRSVVSTQHEYYSFDGNEETMMFESDDGDDDESGMYRQEANNTVNLLELDFAEHMAGQDDSGQSSSEDDDEQVEFVGYNQNRQPRVGMAGADGVEMVAIDMPGAHAQQHEDHDEPLLEARSPNAVVETRRMSSGVQGGMTFWKGTKQVKYKQLDEMDEDDVESGYSNNKTMFQSRFDTNGSILPVDSAFQHRNRANSLTSVKSYKNRQGIIARSRTFLFGKPFGYQEIATVADEYPTPKVSNARVAPGNEDESEAGSEEDSFHFDSDGDPDDFNLVFANVSTFETFGQFTKGDMVGTIPWIVNHPISVVQLVAKTDVVFYGIMIDDLTKVFSRHPGLALAFFKYLASVLGERVDKDEEALCDRYRRELAMDSSAKERSEKEFLRRLLDGKKLTMTSNTSFYRRLRDMQQARKRFQYKNDMEFDTLIEKVDDVQAMLVGDVVLRAGKQEWHGVDTSDTESAVLRPGALFITNNHVCFQSYKNHMQLLKFQNRPKLYGKIHINDIYEINHEGTNGELLVLVTDACKLSILFLTSHRCIYIAEWIALLRKTSSIERAPFSYTLPNDMDSLAFEDDPSFLAYRQQRALRVEYQGLVEALQNILTRQDKWRLFRDSRAVSLKRGQSILNACPENTKHFDSSNIPVGLYLVGKGTMVLQREIYGRRVQFASYKAGAIFGIERFLTGAPSPCTVKVLSRNAQLRFCSTERAMTLLRSDPALAARFYQYCCLSYMLRQRGPIVSRSMNEADEAIMRERSRKFDESGCSIL